MDDIIENAKVIEHDVEEVAEKCNIKIIKLNVIQYMKH